MIYELVLVSPNEITICSPRRKKTLTTMLKRGEAPPHESFADILRANKQIFEEASSIYFSGNVFTFGLSGKWFGSKRVSNMDGLRAFLTRTRKELICFIKTVHIEVHDISNPFQDRLRFDWIKMLTTQNSKDFYVMAKALGKHFPGLVELVIQDSESVSFANAEKILNYPVLVNNLLLSVPKLGRFINHPQFHLHVNAREEHPIIGIPWILSQWGYEVARQDKVDGNPPFRFCLRHFCCEECPYKLAVSDNSPGIEK